MRIEIIRGRDAPPTRAEGWLFALLFVAWFLVVGWVVGSCPSCPELTGVFYYHDSVVVIRR